MHGPDVTEQQQDFQTLMHRIREGSQDAARELFESYGPHIRRVVRRKLHQQLRSKFDSGDFEQAVWASFFALLPQKGTFDRPEALITFLVKLAQNKVIDAVRQRFTQKYDVNREHTFSDSAEYQAAQKQPTPSQIAMAREEWRRLLAGKPAHYQRILILRLQGHKLKEIAEQVDMDEKTVRRVLDEFTPEPDLP
jgi:RNA polymerase sigma factor (sigma-70 family)